MIKQLSILLLSLAITNQMLGAIRVFNRTTYPIKFWYQYMPNLWTTKDETSDVIMPNGEWYSSENGCSDQKKQYRVEVDLKGTGKFDRRPEADGNLHGTIGNIRYDVYQTTVGGKIGFNVKAQETPNCFVYP